MTAKPEITQHTVRLSGRSLAKGRNGEFKPILAELIFFDRLDQPVQFGCYSRKPAEEPPLLLAMTKPDARAVRSLFRKVDGGLSKREYAIEQVLSKIENFRDFVLPYVPNLPGDTAVFLDEIEKVLREAE